MSQSAFKQGAYPSPAYLHADAKDEEGAETVDDLLAAGSKPVDDTRGIGIADIDEDADEENGDQQRAQVEKMD